MKKIVFILFMLFAFVNNAYANEWSEEELIGNNVEKEYRYRFYKEEKVGEYVKVGDDNNYEYEDEGNIYYGEDVYYNGECPSYINEYDKTYLTKYEYKKYLPVKYVKMCNLSDYEMDIESIEFYDNVINALFSSEIKGCTKCQNDNHTVESGGCLTVEMEYPLELNEFTIWLSLGNNSNYGMFELIYSNGIDYNDTDIVGSVKGTQRHKTYQYNSTFTLYPNFTNNFNDYDVEIDDLTIITKKEKICVAKEKNIYRYNVIRNYYDDNYYKNVTELTDLTKEEQLEYKKDENDYKIFYRYTDINEEDTELEEIIIDNIKYDNKLNDELKLVKTGVEAKNYNYLIIFILILILIALFFIKRIKTMSIEKDN